MKEFLRDGWQEIRAGQKSLKARRIQCGITRRDLAKDFFSRLLGMGVLVVICIFNSRKALRGDLW